MKLSRAETAVALFAAAVVFFSAGWFAHGRYDQRALRVEVRRPLGVRAVTAVLPGPAPTADAAPAERVDINTAGVEELMLLPGIGPARAADIVAWREEHGPFRIPEDLTRVNGIGEGILAGLIDDITVGGTQ